MKHFEVIYTRNVIEFLNSSDFIRGRSLSTGVSQDVCHRRLLRVLLDIKVKNCDDSYFVYLLPHTSNCPEAYCAGTEVPCPAGENSENFGFTPNCTANFPTIEMKPQLTNGTRNGEVVMFCDFDPPPWDNLTVEVFWTADGDVIDEATLVNGEDQSVLDQAHLKLGMGKEISCKVRGRYEDGGAPGTLEVSNGFFAGMKILKKVFTVDEDGPTNSIQLQPTLPLDCSFGYLAPYCFVSIPVTFEEESRRLCGGDGVPQVVADGTKIPSIGNDCPFKYGVDDWGGIIELPVIAVRDSQVDGLGYMKVKFGPFSSGQSDLWAGYQLEDVEILSVDKDSIGDVTCTSTGDPHYTTFDGRYYHVYEQGTFTLYKHQTLPIEVQTRTRLCFGDNVACNCGVAVRSGNETLILTKCTDGVQRYNFSSGTWTTYDGFLASRIDHYGPVGEDINFYQASDSRFYVFLPTGSLIDILVTGDGVNPYIDISIRPSVDDKRKTSGLCGTFDGNITNDGLHSDISTVSTIHENQVMSNGNSAFVNSWRVEDDDNIFMGNVHPSPPSEIERRYCSCVKRPVAGDGREHNIHCKISPAYDCVAKQLKSRRGVQPMENNGARKRRDTSYNDEVYDDDMFGFDNSVPTAPAVAPSWPAPNGMTEAETRAYCEDNLVNSPSGKLCTLLLGDTLDTASMVESCVVDIQATGNTVFVQTAITSLEARCSDALYKNLTYWTSNISNVTGNVTSEPPSFFFETVSCPSNCSGRGICEKGECICQKGFEGPSCSIETDAPPKAYFIPKDGLCDTNTRPCERTPVIGKDFLQSGNLTCSLQTAQIDGNGVQLLPDPVANIAVPATFEDESRVICPLPPSRVRRSTSAGHRTTAEATLVSISNDGVRFSPPVLLITYDAVCQDCNVTGFCVLRNNSCEIDGACYADGDTQIGNWCKQCVPAVNVSTWSDRQDNAPPVFEPTGNIIAFINNQLDFTVKAEDPENRPHLSYSLVGAPPDPDLSLTSAGQLKWTPKQNSTIVVNVMAADECGLSSTESLTVTARDCPCQHGGSCPSFALDSPDNINCTCSGTGFTGQMCDVDVDECLDSPCDHGVCNNTVGGFHCDCEQYYTGPLCDQETPCFSNPCPDNGTCADIPGAIQCTICPEGSPVDSSLCVIIEIPLDPCSSNPCYPDVTCDVVDDVYTCGPCPAGLTGDGVNCVEDVGCSSKPCYPEVTCTDVPGGHECGDCPHGMTGDGKNCTEDTVTGVTDQQGFSWYEQPANIALLSVGAVVLAAALIGVAVWRVKAHNVTRGKVGDLPLEERRKSDDPQDLHVEEMSDQDCEHD
ncbi:VWDE [Branchiostoma lanceolatum]|uniref:VWDE protein n=1 Tax=Branchiostoma lanceolatum TaxID=7740 RepID=A0A8J9ZRR0_BRALA|nr:VWDE [Branchiostoma lanceolatum]